MNDTTIRPIRAHEYQFLEEMLCEAIYIHDREHKLSKELIYQPELYKYVAGFGKETDLCFVAEINKELCGAIWARIFNNKNKGYGFVDDQTPEISMAISCGYRNMGIGTKLLAKILDELKGQKFRQVSLSVDKRNAAYNLYKRFNFIDISKERNSVTMLKKLND